MSLTTVNPDSEERKKEETRVSNWLIAGALGAAVAVTVAGTVYYVNRERKKELKSYRYGSEGPTTVESYKETINRYWNFASNAFSAVQTVVADFLTSTKTVAMSPLTNASQSKTSKHFQSDQEVPDVLEDEAVL